MLKITTFDQTRYQFQGYDELFDYCSEIENLKLIQENPDFKSMNWSFTVYNPEQVKALQAHMKNQPAAIREAFEHDLSVIEICTGDFENPLYVPVAPNLDWGSLKEKWCVDYCAARHIAITDTVDGNTEALRKRETVK